MKKIGRLALLTSKNVSDKCRVSIGFECLDRELFNPDKCYDLLYKSGVKYARCQTGWARCEKKKGVYNFDWLDSIVDNLIARGIIPWFNVGFGNPLYMKNIKNSTAVGCVPLLYGNETLNRWRNYIKALAEHFKGRVTHFEIWNEPDLIHFWYPSEPNPAQYAELIKITGGEIRSVIENAKIGGSISNFNTKYFSAVLECLSPNDIDFYAYHRYTKHLESDYAELIGDFREILENHNMSHIELWQGEGGFPSWAPEGHWLNFKNPTRSERQQAVWQLRLYFWDSHLGIVKSSFFQMVDMWEKAYEKARDVIDKPAAHGILNGITYTPKKSYETISRLATIFNGEVFPDDTETEISIIGECCYQPICFSYKKEGKKIKAFYLVTDVEDEIDVDVKCSIKILSSEFEEPILIDMYNGNVYKFEKTDFSVVGEIIAPIKEYPLVICERSAYTITN